MAVPDQTPISSHLGNGIASTFSYEFLALQAADLVVKVAGVEVTGFTVAGLGEQSGGTVTLPTAPASGALVVIYRDSEVARLVADYQNSGDFLAATVNRDFDRLWLVLQELALGSKGVTTALRVPNGETLPALPAAASRAGFLLGFDTAGAPTLVTAASGSALALAQELASPSGGLLIRIANEPGEAGSHTLQDIDREILTARKFGIKGDGTDETDKIQRAIERAENERGALIFGDGQFKHSGLFFEAQSGLDFCGSRQPHPNNQKGTSFLYTGTGRAFTIADDSGAGGFLYRVMMSRFALYFEQNAQAGIYAKNLQECVFSDVGVWAGSRTVGDAFDLDGVGIVHLDLCVGSRTTRGVRFHYGDLPNPQATGGSSITRCNFYYHQDALTLGYTLGLNVLNTWFEGFQNAIVANNANPNQRTEVTGLVVESSDFLQSTPGLTQTRALKVISGDNSRPVRFFTKWGRNRIFMNSSGATAPSHAVEFNLAGNSSVVDGRADFVGNWFHGHSVSAIANDSPKIIVHDERNESRDGLFGNILPTFSGAGTKLTECYTLARSATTVAAPAGTAESVLATLDLPANLITAVGSWRLKGQWSFTNNANGKVIRVRLGDAAGPIMAQHDAGGLAVGVTDTHVAAKGSVSSQMATSTLSGKLDAWRGLGSIDTRNSVPIIITVQKAVGADTVNLESWILEVMP